MVEVEFNPEDLASFLGHLGGDKVAWEPVQVFVCVSSVPFCLFWFDNPGNAASPIARRFSCRSWAPLVGDGDEIRVRAQTLCMCEECLVLWAAVLATWGRAHLGIEITNQIADDVIIFAWRKRSYLNHSENLSHSLFLVFPINLESVSGFCNSWVNVQ